MFQNIIEHKNFVLQKKVKDWKEAIITACSILEKRSCVSDEYAKYIIERTIEYGAYYVIAPRIAIPHASADQGVLKTSFSLITLESPMPFDKTHGGIQLIITLAISGTRMGGSYVDQLINFCKNSLLIDSVLACKTEEELKTSFNI